MEIEFVRHNGSSSVGSATLAGPVPRIGELIHVPQHLVEDMEGHTVAIVADVQYRVADDDSELQAFVRAIASHDDPQQRHLLLLEMGWLDEQLNR